MARPTYRTVVEERHVPVARGEVWQAVLDLVPAASGEAAAAEAPLAIEAPWRLVTSVETSVPTAELTVAIVEDDGPGSVVTVSAVVGPERAGLDDVTFGKIEHLVRSRADALAAGLA